MSQSNRKGRRKFRLLICGEADEGYSRDVTLFEALQRMKNIRIIDFRLMWKTSINSDRDNKITIKMRVLKKYYFYAIKYLIYTSHVDAIMINKLNCPLVIQIAPLARKKNIPLIYDLWVSRYIKAQRDDENPKYWYNLEKQVIDQCDFLLATTQQYKEYYTKIYGIDEGKIFVVPLAVEDYWIYEPLYREKIDQKIFKVGYWGNYLKQHGVPLALEAATKLSIYQDIHFYFYSVGSSESIVITNGYRSYPNIHFLNFSKEKKDLVKFVDEMDISFGHLLAIHDAHLMLPNKALEGMARGKVVLHVDTDLLYTDYCIADREKASIVFFNSTVDGLIEKIINLKQNRNLDTICMNAKRKIREDHSIESMTPYLTYLFDRIDQKAK